MSLRSAAVSRGCASIFTRRVPLASRRATSAMRTIVEGSWARASPRSRSASTLASSTARAKSASCRASSRARSITYDAANSARAASSPSLCARSRMAEAPSSASRRISLARSCASISTRGIRRPVGINGRVAFTSVASVNETRGAAPALLITRPWERVIAASLA